MNAGLIQMDFYSDIILSPDKAVRYRITKEKLLHPI